MFATAEQVRQYSGVKPKDLGFETDADLDAWIAAGLIRQADLINTYVGKVWTAETVPPGVQQIALDMARNTVISAVVSRDTPVAQLGDFSVRISEPSIFTQSIKDALNAYKESVARPAGSAVIRMFRVRTKEEDYDVE